MQVAGGRRNKKQRNREARREAREAQRAAQADREARVQIGSRYDDIRRARDAAREAAELAAVGACMHNGFVPWLLWLQLKLFTHGTWCMPTMRMRRRRRLRAWQQRERRGRRRRRQSGWA
jgi:hypothetical protein